MNSFRFAISGLIYRMFFLLILSAALGALLTRQEMIIAAPVFVFLVMGFFNTLYFVNSVNRKLSFFFDSVRNEDLSLRFPEKVASESLRSLHKSMNSINSLISDYKIQHEHREKFFWGMIAGSATGHLALDETGYIEMINNAALRFLGLTYISHINLLKQKKKPFYDVLTQIRPGQVQTLKTLDGQELRHLSIKVSQLKFNNKHYRLFSIYDIKAELEENELDSWQKLIRVLTHEIMNSIAPITSMSNTLQGFFCKNNGPVQPDQINERVIGQTLIGLEVIEQQGKGLINFVEAYRQLTKIPKPSFKSINPVDFLNHMQIFLQPKLEEEKVEFSIEAKHGDKMLYGDEKLLSQVILNLVNNSIEALRSIEQKKIWITISVNINGRLVICITDNGTGIDPENLEKVFIPFFTTRENGSGIGLSLSRQIMRLHKGSLNMQSWPGKETVVQMVF